MTIDLLCTHSGFTDFDIQLTPPQTYSMLDLFHLLSAPLLKRSQLCKTQAPWVSVRMCGEGGHSPVAYSDFKHSKYLASSFR